MDNRRIIVEIGSKKASFCITSQRHGKQRNPEKSLRFRSRTHRCRQINSQKKDIQKKDNELKKIYIYKELENSRNQ